jgi:hypothetical protein
MNRSILFAEIPILRHRGINVLENRSIDFLDVHVARYNENTSWSDSLKTLGANVTVWTAEGLDEEISYLKDFVTSYNTSRAAKVFLHGKAPTDYHSTRGILGVISRIDLSKLKERGGYASLASGKVREPGRCPLAGRLPAGFEKDAECYGASKDQNCRRHCGSESPNYQWRLLRYRMDCHWKDDLWVKMLKSRWHLPSENSLSEIGGYCCSQFVVTRDAIHQYPISFYESLLKRMSSKQPWSHLSHKTLGRTMDYLWHFIFTGVMVEPRYSPTAFTIP